MNSTKSVGEAVARLVRSTVVRTWAVVLLLLKFVVGLFALGGLGDLLVLEKDLPPVKVIFFPHETHVCLAVTVIWAVWKVRSYVRARSPQEGE